MSTIDELTTPMTVAEAQEAIYAALAARGVATTSWKPGAVVRTIIAALAIILAALSSLQALIARAGFLGLSSGAWLTLVARYVYNVERDLGSFATGTITATNITGNIYTLDPGDLVVFSPTSLKTYRNTEAVEIGSLEPGLEIAIQADELGSGSSATAGLITGLVTTLNGVSVTNEAALVGTDEETDALLRQRCRAKTGTLSPNGPRDAYTYFARSAVRSDGTSIGVTRVKSIADGYGGVDVYVATATGGVTGDEEDPETDLGAIFASLEQNVVPLGITLRTHSATGLAIAVTYELWVRNTVGMTNTQIASAVATKLMEFMSTQPIGGEIIVPDPGRVYVTAIQAAIAAALPFGSVIRIAVTLPAADVDIDVDEAPVLGTLTVTAIHQVAGDQS